jgi:hypothetical protein
VVAPTFVAAELGQAPLEEAPLASETNGGPSADLVDR